MLQLLTATEDACKNALSRHRLGLYVSGQSIGNFGSEKLLSKLYTYPVANSTEHRDSNLSKRLSVLLLLEAVFLKAQSVDFNKLGRAEK
jgi:hypothetical protein